MATLGQFAKRMEKLAVTVEKNSNENAIRLGARIAQVVVVATPVDTGRARANYIASIAQPVLSPTEDEDPEGRSTISRATAVMRTKQPEETIYITNNVAYITKLDQGHSAQAPAGFIGQSVNTAVASFRNRKVLPQ